VSNEINIALQVVTIAVLIFTCLAAFRQATAATRLIEATNQQIKTSENLALAARSQNEIALRQIEEAVRPILIFTWEWANTYIRFPKVRNDGSGPALDCRWYYGQIATTFPREQPMPAQVIGSDHDALLEIDAEKAKNQGVTVVYRSLGGKQYATEVLWTEGDYSCRYQEYVSRSA
jgi:hypothetical protein